MSFLRNNKSDEDDRDALVDNEERPPPSGTLYDDGEDYGGGFIAANTNSFTAATLPAEMEDESIEVPLRSVLISNAPSDGWNLTFIVFYLLGTATMTPWNFFITAEDYWMYKYRNVTFNDTDNIVPELTPLQKSFTCDLTLTASISGTTFLILNVIYGQHISHKLKILGTLLVILIMFIITTAFVEVNTDQWQEQFFLITLLTVVIINISSATMSGGIFGIAGLFPSEYMTALVSGQALGGIFTALTFILVLAFGTAPNITAFIYFIIGSILILLSIISYVIMSQQSFYKYYLEGGDKYKIISETPSHSRTEDVGVVLEPNIKEVFGKIYVEAVGLFLLYATTLSVYPAISELMQSEGFGNGRAWNDTFYMPVVNYLFFNSGDYFGRIFAGLWERPRNNPHTALLMTLLRILYIPFFLCSNSNVHAFLPILVHSDVAFILMMLTFALTNGYITNIYLIMAPRAVMQHEKELASSIMAASLSSGLAFGSMLSMVFVQLL